MNQTKENIILFLDYLVLSREWLQKQKRGRKGMGKQRFRHTLRTWQTLDTKQLREEQGYQADIQCLFFFFYLIA